MRLPLTLATAAVLLLSSATASAAPKPSRACDFLDPAVCLQPWPNDHFRKNGHVALKKKAIPENADGKRPNPSAWNRNDGFSPGQTILTRVPKLDLGRSKAVRLKDLSRYTARKAPILVINARTGDRHPIWAELDPYPAKRADVNLQIRPAVNWDEGERYIVALRNLKNRKGKKLRAGAAFRLYRDKKKTDNKLIEARRKHMNAIFRTLKKKAKVKRGSLYLAWDFTVASRDNLTERALHIRDDAFALLGDTDLDDGQIQGTAPAFAVTKVEDITDEPGVDQRIEGTYQVPCYLDSADCEPGGDFVYPGRKSNLPERPDTDNFRTAPFWCNVPTSANPGNKALAVQYGHGLLGSGSQVYSESDIQRMAENHNAMYCATNWTGMDNPSIPFAIEVLQDLSLFSKFADRLQQGLVDQLYLGRLMAHPQGLGSHDAFQQGNQPLFEGSQLMFDSNSQGGIMGGALTALAPDYENAVLGVPAMNYSILLRRSVDWDVYAEVNTPAYPNNRERPLMLGLWQMLWDRGENNGYAHHIVGDPLPGTPDHNVLMHVAIGDHQVTTIQADVMARTIGARVRQPAVDEGRSFEDKPLFDIPPIGSFPFTGDASMVYWDTGPVRQVGDETAGTGPAPLGEEPNRTGADPHGRPRKDPNAQEQKVEFMLNGSVIDVCGAFPCYVDGYTGP
ncbi:MAG TPA: hypothetical protein VD790_10965 [Thermoleophilaceae bacterium]|nr:hypothetical protein [Thermoleophilaceae bacterium]